VTGCSVCRSPQVGAIDSALGAGTSIRDIAGQFGVSRSALSRHKGHAGGGDQFAEALALLERTPPERGREHLRALEAARAALDLELRDWKRARVAIKRPTSEQERQLRENLRRAWAAYERAKNGGTETALRALQGVREAERSLRQAMAAQRQGGTPLQVVVSDSGGANPSAPVPWSGVTREEFMAGHGVPEEYWSDHQVTVRLNFFGHPDVLVHDGEGKLVWIQHGAPGPGPRGRRALAHEEPPGTGTVAGRVWSGARTTNPPSRHRSTSQAL
jgi:hypothetical protein